MALDTVIDKEQFEAALTASADAIREKTGDTALIQWLADKGFAEAIAAIEAGGVGGFVTGTFTLAEALAEPMVIEHNLGVIPELVVLLIEINVDSDITRDTVFVYTANRTIMSQEGTTQGYTMEFRRYDTTNRSRYSASLSPFDITTKYQSSVHTLVSAATETTINIHNGVNGELTPGYQYRYILVGELQ